MSAVYVSGRCSGTGPVSDRAAVSVIPRRPRFNVADDLIDACERYLADKGCTLWGRAWDIIRPTERRKAAEWLAQQVEAVQAEAARPMSNGKVT